MSRTVVFRPLIALALIGLPVALNAQEAAPAETAEALNERVNAPLPPAEAAMKAHVMFLASDAMRGREAGSAEYDIAAQYVASQFYAAGLRPAGDAGSYLQQVPLLSYRPAEEGTVTLSRAGKPVALTFGEDYLPNGNPERAATLVDAPVVFAGYGIVAPHYKRDDYKGVDARGKIVAFFSGAPGDFDGEERAHFGSNANKAATAAKMGAAGVIVLETPTSARVRPFSRLADGWDAWRMTWADAQGNGHLPAQDAGAPVRLRRDARSGAEDRTQEGDELERRGDHRGQRSGDEGRGDRAERASRPCRRRHGGREGRHDL